VPVFLTTHYMDEAERVAHRIAVIDHGRIVAQGTPAELKQQTNTDSLEAVANRSLGRIDRLRDVVRARCAYLARNPELVRRVVGFHRTRRLER
jgi:ABC-2 type transport system ATP-binding protein